MTQYVKPRAYGEPISMDAPGFNPTVHKDLVIEVNEALEFVRTEVNNALGGDLILVEKSSSTRTPFEWNTFKKQVSYTHLSSVAVSYSDNTGKELTDGSIPSSSYGDAGWVGWSSAEAVIKFNFGRNIIIEKVRLYVFDGGSGGISSPQSVKLRVENSGVYDSERTYPVGTGDNRWIEFDVADFPVGSAVEIKLIQRSGSGWIFLGEVEFVLSEEAGSITVNNLPAGYSLRDDNFTIPGMVPMGIVKRYSIVEDSTRDILTSAFMEAGDVWEYKPRTQREFNLPPQLRRETATLSTSQLEPKTSEILTLDTPGGFEVVTLSTSSPARVRAYPTQALAVADRSRSMDTDPSGIAGCLLEVITSTSDLTIPLGPSVHLLGSNSSEVSVVVDNLDAVKRIIVVNLEGITTEF